MSFSADARLGILEMDMKYVIRKFRNGEQDDHEGMNYKMPDGDAAGGRQRRQERG